MSINVTVSGNPVRISRGKMVTGYDPSGGEFERRRLMRIEQVRQQSKDIAENIRNKLKKAKNKRASDAEKTGEAQLRNWQARKLLELQNQYQEAIDEIGLGHQLAAREEREEEALLAKEEGSRLVARARGRAASERLQVETNEENLKKAAPSQRRKMARDEENARAENVARQGRQGKSPFKKHKRKPSDSDRENRVPRLFELGAEDEWEGGSGAELDAPRNSKEAISSKERQTSSKYFKVPTSDKAAQTLDDVRNDFPLDTRITERIRQRSDKNLQLDYCEFVEKDQHCNYYCKGPPKTREKATLTEDPIGINGNKIKDAKRALYVKPKEKVFDETPKTDLPQRGETSSSKTTIPSTQKVTLGSGRDRTSQAEQVPKPVTYYDHPTRFGKQYLPKIAYVEKIDPDSLVVLPNILSEEEMAEKMRQRDVEAQVRGRVAMEKERLQREYRELLKKLPMLQKQERICEVGMDKERYHMSRERLEEMERKRQNRLDNAYEELFVRRQPAPVTIPRRPVETKDPPILNVGSWDVDFEPGDAEHSTRSEQLGRMLSNLRAQKDSLLKEIENTISTKEGPQSKSSDVPKKKKRKRRRDDRPVSPELDEGTTTRSTKKGTTTTTTTTTTSPSPKKKPKIKSSTTSRVLVLQNMSTQTTPKTEQSAATSPFSTLESCVCTKSKTSDDLCEILIKIREDEKPQVVVNPLSPAVEVVAEEEVSQETSVKKLRVRKPKETLKSSKGTSKETLKPSTPDSSRETLKPPKSTSWREQLSNSSNTTSSTTYMDPPNSTKSVAKTDLSSTSLDPRLLTYIRKLLDMSRCSVEELGVSAASDVSTPSGSVVDTSTNNPMQQLANVIKYFNLDVGDLQKQLSNSSSMLYNTASSAVSDEEKGSCRSESAKKLSDFADIAASCTKKISSLTAMIERVREEKKRMMTSPSSSSDDRDLSTTSYLQLPPKKKMEEQDVSSTSSNGSQDELQRQLLSIDLSYAEELKKLTPEELQSEKKQVEEQAMTDQELLSRLRDLVQSSAPVAQPPSTDEPRQPFPLLLDIAKLPRLEAPSLDKTKRRPPTSKGLRAISGNVPVLAHELSTILEADSQISTKGESPLKRVTSGTSSQSSSVPDLLTEVPKSNNNSTSGDVSEIETMETMLTSIGMEWAIPTLKKTREALAMSSSSSGSKKESGDVSLRDFLSKLSSSSSKSEGSMFSEAPGVSLIEVDNRRTSTPVVQLQETKKRSEGPIFVTDSDISSVREHSSGSKEKFYDPCEASLSKTG